MTIRDVGAAAERVKSATGGLFLGTICKPLMGARGFASEAVPGIAVNVVECAAGTTQFPTSDYTTRRAVTAGFHGEFKFTIGVRRNLAAFVSPNGATNIDCAAAPG